MRNVKSTLNYLKIVICFIAFFCIVGAKSYKNKTSTEIGDELNAVYQKIDFLAGAALCETDLQCCSVPLGQKACGGPEDHKIYSTLTSDSKVLKELSIKSAELETEMNSRSGTISICSLIIRPIVVCNNYCVEKYIDDLSLTEYRKVTKENYARKACSYKTAY